VNVVLKGLFYNTATIWVHSVDGSLPDEWLVQNDMEETTFSCNEALSQYLPGQT
jgi:hypothetical protein